MFNLDQTISEWRRQMLAAGIKTPVPLEELEIHLREEIIEQIKLGLNDEEAFKAAAGKVGQADQLLMEFKKVEKDPAITRAILLVIGWLAASCALAYGVVTWDFDWNLFHFSPRWNPGVIVVLSIIPVALTSMWVLAKATRDKMSRVAGLLFSVFLAAGSVLCFPSEKISAPQAVPALSPQMTSDQVMRNIAKIKIDRAISNVFSRSVPSPLWFRSGRTLLLCLPVTFWALWTWRHLTQVSSPTRRNQPIYSD